MRVACLILLVSAGCNQLFEENPDFLETDSEADVDSSGVDVGASDTMAEGDTANDTTDATSDDTVCESDEYETNDEEMDAAGLMAVTPGAAMAEMASATMEGPGAVDWYRTGVPDAGNDVLKVSVTIDSGFDVCVYYKCTESGESATVSCGMGEQPATNNLGYDGCCGNEVAQPTYECDGTPGGDATAFMRVSDPMNRDACVPYTLLYQLIGA